MSKSGIPGKETTTDIDSSCRVGIVSRFRSLRVYPYLLGIALGLAGFALFLQLASLWKEFGYRSAGTTDLVAYWGASRLMWDGENPYDFAKLYDIQLDQGFRNEEPIVMWNPPWLLVWLAPLSFLPFPAAVVVWMVVSGGLILLSASLVWLSLGESETVHNVGLAWVAAFAFVPCLFMLQMGQMSSLLILGLAGFFYFESRGQEYSAGTYLALTTIKPHVVYLVWVALLWWILTQRRWKSVAGILTVLLPSIALLAIFRPAAITGYRAILAQPPVQFTTPTFGGIARLLTVNHMPWIQFAIPFVTGLAVLVYLCVRRCPFQWKLDLEVLLLVSVPTAAYGWSFDQVVLILPYLRIVSWATAGELGHPRRTAAVLIALALISIIAVGQNLLLAANNLAHFYFWIPLALAAVYFYARYKVNLPKLRSSTACL
jgi:hypothetical protein